MRTLPQAMMLSATLACAVQALGLDVEPVVAGCEYCHGVNGISVDGHIPIIAGQPEALIAVAHEQFKDWARACTTLKPPRGGEEMAMTSMCEISSSLDTATINALATHYAALPFVPAPQSFDPTQGVEGARLHQLYCASCHLNGGAKAGFAGRLAGQWTPYLALMLERIKREEITVPHVMQRKVSEFSEAEISALLNFWASQQE